MKAGGEVVLVDPRRNDHLSSVIKVKVGDSLKVSNTYTVSLIHLQCTVIRQ